MDEPTRRITINQFNLMQREVFCYGWWRKDRYLYIGVTTIGFRRIVQHTVIGISMPFEEGDELHFWDLPFDEAMEKQHGLRMVLAKQKMLAYELEDKLIAHWQPVLNMHGTGKKREEKKCKNCQELFMAQREWQEFCTKGCREQHWNKSGRKTVEPLSLSSNGLKKCPHCKAEFVLTLDDSQKRGSEFCPTCRPMVAGSYWAAKPQSSPETGQNIKKEETNQ